MLVFSVAPTLSTNTESAGDVVSNQFSLPVGGQPIQLDSLSVFEKTDQGLDFDVYLFNSEYTALTLGSAFAPDDATAAKIISVISVASGDYSDVGGSRIAFKRSLNHIIFCPAGTVYGQLVIRGAGGTYSAADALTLRFGLKE